MGNNKNIPNLQFLINKWKKEWFYEWDYNLWYELQLQEIINILKSLDWFKLYLEKNNYNEDYTWTYFIFGLIIEYIYICYKNNNIEEIKNIFEYLNELSKSNDDDILNLLVVWALEVFDIHIEILPDIIELMPKNLKELFMKYFSDYLN